MTQVRAVRYDNGFARELRTGETIRPEDLGTGTADSGKALFGIGHANGDEPMWIDADTINNRAQLNSHDTDASNHSHHFSFMYKIL